MTGSASTMKTVKFCFPTHNFYQPETGDSNLVTYETSCAAFRINVLCRRRYQAAQLRKEVRYHELIETIKENNWNAELFTIEVGARGMIGNRTFRAFAKLVRLKIFRS